MNSKYSELFICSTDTVTGIGGPVDPKTLELIYELKNRPLDKKIIILVGSMEQVQKFSEWNEEANSLALKLWPGAHTIIVNNQGFRMPNSRLLLEFLIKNGPMYVSSANKSGYPPINLDQAHQIFPEILNIYDFGKGSNKPSIIHNLDTGEIINR
ncbi:L-threonylcarbamoyladenylate synthase [Mycoplasmopsis felis]|uniref:L-threonylcarbamoyladenylate synthase n=1 Tax=Mycoplasmopsis felis TaxID=33923 RepID=UPI002AFF1655|nr:Sua5/YciO/YrdC/YwlC family protein [Mycoplasmopsis felis]WQQ04725.1 Sua5/YciO/YrdC/YwlC family protein [Mycoplasmopsis felis]